MRMVFAIAAGLFLAAGTLAAQQNRTGQNSASGRNLLSSPSSGRTSSKDNARRGIFDIATSSNSGKTNTSGASAAGRTATTSPFGTTSPRTARSSARHWKTNSKIADCIREKAIPANTNLSFSGTITNIVTDGRYTIITMFASIETVAENGAKGDVPVTITVVMDAEAATGSSFKENAKKNFTVDSNYAYLVWNDSGCTLRAVDNSLTEPDPKANAKR